MLLFAAEAFPDRCPSPLVGASGWAAGKTVVAPVSLTLGRRGAQSLSFLACGYENHELQTFGVTVVGFEKSLLAPNMVEGAFVAPGTPLTLGGKVLVDGLTPHEWARRRPCLWAPRTEPVLLVVDVEGHQATRFERGVRTHTWEVGRGQAEGRKEKRGDLKTPRGLYFVTSRSTGPFSGDFAAYYGGHWVKLNYPNSFDATLGGLSAQAAHDIGTVWWRRALTPQGTALGGGIGFHGWIAPWRGDVEGYGLSWGCVVAHPEDIAELYARLPVGAAVVLE